MASNDRSVTAMEDQIEPKTEPTLPSKSELEDHDLASPLPACGHETRELTNDEPVTNGKRQSSSNEFDKTNSSGKHEDAVVSSSQYLTVQSAIRSIGERPWDSHVVIPPGLNTEIVIHGHHSEANNSGHHSEANNSTSAETVIDSDLEFKPLTEDILEKPDENSNPECDYIFCIAAITRTSSNNLKVLAISRIDTNIKVDLKSDGSSLNGYAADYSSSSTNSTMCGQIDEKFLVPKIPPDSFMSSSSSGSSTGVLPHLKSKPNNILLSKNVYTYPENLVCHKCNHIYPRVSEKCNLDSKDFSNATKLKTCVGKSKQKIKPKQSSINNDSSSKKTLNKSKLNTQDIFAEKTDIKIEELQSNNIPGDSVENKINEPISFNLGDEVLAFWVSDKFFYPAIIIDVVSPKFKVKFMSDCVVKTMNIDALVHSSALKKGSPIAIFDTVSQEYRVGEIVSINVLSNGDKTYSIDLDSEEVVVPFDKLVLSTEHARMLQDKNVFKNYHRLSMSNVSEGKRIRSSRQTTTKCIKKNTANTKNESSKRKKTAQGSGNSKKRKCLFPVEPDPRYIPSTSTGITGDDYDLCIQPSSDSDFDIIREDLTTVDMSEIRNSDIDSEHLSPDKTVGTIKSPIRKSIKVFKDLHFVISYAKYKRIPMTNDSDQSTDHDASYNTNFFKPDKPHKKYLETLIRKNGGSVHSFLNVIPRSCYKFSYLITDTPSQTCNFYLCLSLGIPSYHHKHVENAVSQKLPFSEYLTKYNVKPIPNGYSDEKKEVIFRSPKTVHSIMFSGYIIYLALSDTEKNEFFASLLRFCGAIVYTSWKNGVCLPLTRHTTIIITDEHCPSDLEHVKVPKLSTNWLIQSLICESARPFDGHESYVAIADN